MTTFSKRCDGSLQRDGRSLPECGDDDPVAVRVKITQRKETGGRKREEMKVIKSVAILLAALALNACGAAASSSVQTPAPVVLRGQQWNIKIDPASLGIWGLLPGADEEIILAAPAATTAEITDLKTSERQVSW